MNHCLVPPREAGRLICSKSKHVQISREGVSKVAKEVVRVIRKNKADVSVDRWKTHELLPQSRDDFALNWVFVSDLLNFSFWTDPDMKYAVRYKNKTWTGYWSLCAAMWRSIEEGFDLTNPRFYSEMDEQRFEYIFRSDTEYKMPLLHERFTCLKSAGKVMLEEFGGLFRNVANNGRGSAVLFLREIVDNFESFRDEVVFENQKLAIYKRAQILVGDVWACFGGEGIGKFSDIDEMTAFADYRVPQALVWLGTTEYSDELKTLLEKGHMFSYGDVMEIEIRGSTIHCIDLIVNEVNKLLKAIPEAEEIQVNSITIDHYLWDLRRENDEKMRDIPFHKVRCIYY